MYLNMIQYIMYPNGYLKQNEAITHHKIIKWIVIGNFLQGEIGVKDVVRDSLPT